MASTTTQCASSHTGHVTIATSASRSTSLHRPCFSAGEQARWREGPGGDSRGSKRACSATTARAVRRWRPTGSTASIASAVARSICPQSASAARAKSPDGCGAAVGSPRLPPHQEPRRPDPTRPLRRPERRDRHGRERAGACARKMVRPARAARVARIELRRAKRTSSSSLALDATFSASRSASSTGLSSRNGATWSTSHS